MPSSGLGAYQVKIHQLIFGGLFVFAVFAGVRTMMRTGPGALSQLAALSLAVAILLILDKRYWILCPLLFTSQLDLPGLPFKGRELACISLIGTYFVRNALRRDPTVPSNRVALLALPYSIWVAFVWFLNPSGMFLLGSQTIGSRFYFIIVLGTLAVFVLSSMRFSERDCRWIFIATLLGYIISIAMLTGEVIGSRVSVDASRATHYNFSEFSYVFVLLLCRYHLDGLLSISWRPVAAFVACSLTAYAGHRTSFGRVMAAPVLFALFTRRTRLLTGAIYLCAAFLLLVAISGHGTYYTFPFSVQRALSFIPADWEPGLEEYGFKDIFRDEMRDRAKEVVRTSPWVGLKGFSIDLEQAIWARYGSVGDGFWGHALARNWHNVWYGLAADFGIPASCIWAFFWFASISYCIRKSGSLGYGSWAHSTYLFFLIMVVYSFLKSFGDGGHSATTPFESYYWFGMMLAILNGAKFPTQAESKRVNG